MNKTEWGFVEINMRLGELVLVQTRIKSICGTEYQQAPQPIELTFTTCGKSTIS